MATDALSVDIRAEISATETLSGGDIATPQIVQHTGYNQRLLADGTTTPDLTKAAYEQVNLVAGAASIDLTALQLNGAAVDLTGTQPRGILITALAANVGDITVSKGVTNGYTGAGAAFSVTLNPGMSVLLMWTLDNALAVGAGAKTLDLAGTGTDGVQLSAVAGS